MKIIFQEFFTAKYAVEQLEPEKVECFVKKLFPKLVPLKFDKVNEIWIKCEENEAKWIIFDDSNTLDVVRKFVIGCLNGLETREGLLINFDIIFVF